ncbi:MAG: hypothetical protein KDC05_11010 [Bacteroidales bacterium]|nr:hypothetical protein [Bacteroidales bacterium]
MYTKKIFTILVVEFLLIIQISIGQDAFYLVNGGRATISAGTVFTVNDLDIGAGSQLVNRGNLTVNGVLANDAGTPGLILKADTSGYGSLMHNNTGVYATVEQYLTSERWHLVSPPVLEETIEVYLNIYLKEWEEPTANWHYWVQPLSTPINAMRGYATWAVDSLTGNTTVDFEGELVSGNIGNINLTHTEGSDYVGWNLVGNPYPSAVEWNTDWLITGLNGWAIVYENGTNKGWNPWLPEGDRSFNGKTDGWIAPGQGFWVHALEDDPYMLIPQSARQHQPVPFLKEQVDSECESIHLTATANNFSDETVILFLEGAELGFDILYDLEKHMNVSESPNIYSLPATGKKHAVNVLPADWIETSEPAIVPIGFEIGPQSSCVLTATGIESFDPNLTIMLEDKKEDVFHNLCYDPEYTFEATEGDDPDRFLLHFGDLTDIDELQSSVISIYSFKDNIYISMPANNHGYAIIYDMQGRVISETILHADLTKIKIDRTGYYVVKAQSIDNVCIQNVFIKH